MQNYEKIKKKKKNHHVVKVIGTHVEEHEDKKKTTITVEQMNSCSVTERKKQESGCNLERYPAVL